MFKFIVKQIQQSVGQRSERRVGGGRWGNNSSLGRSGVASLHQWDDARPDTRMGQQPKRRLGRGWERNDSSMERRHVESLDERHDAITLWRVGQ